MVGFDFNYFIKGFFTIGKALPITLSIGMFSMIFGLIIGITITMVRKSKNKALSRIFDGYVSIFRGTPLMVQIFVFFFGLPQIISGLAKISAYSAAVIVLSINASAYISEIMRASIDAVDKGQLEAGLSVGMSKLKVMERIILPQAMKIATPPLGNTFISIIQGTAIFFMIGIKDIMGISKVNAAASYRFLESFLTVGIIYWVITLIATKVNKKIEIALSKGGAL